MANSNLENAVMSFLTKEASINDVIIAINETPETYRVAEVIHHVFMLMDTKQRMMDAIEDTSEVHATYINKITGQ